MNCLQKCKLQDKLYNLKNRENDWEKDVESFPKNRASGEIHWEKNRIIYKKKKKEREIIREKKQENLVDLGRQVWQNLIS